MLVYEGAIDSYPKKSVLLYLYVKCFKPSLGAWEGYCINMQA